MKKILALSLLISASMYSMKDSKSDIEVNEEIERYIFTLDDGSTTSIFKMDPSFKLNGLVNGKNVLVSLYRLSPVDAYYCLLPIGHDYVVEWNDAPKVEVLPPNE